MPSIAHRVAETSSLRCIGGLKPISCNCQERIPNPIIKKPRSLWTVAKRRVGKDFDRPWERFEKPEPSILRSRLTKLQYRVTQGDDTEPAFRNEYWDHHEPGIYVDVVSGEPLFASIAKFDSGTGWPSFAWPIEPGYLVYREDVSGTEFRIEVRSKHGDSHLGHVFSDGPQAMGGRRYCMNSAALRFVPVEQLEKQGYGEFRKIFEQKKNGQFR